WTDYEASRWIRAKSAFSDGIAIARNAGVNVILIYVPTKYRVYREFIQLPAGSPMSGWDVWRMLPENFAEVCQSVGVPGIDLTLRFQQAVREGANPYALTDTHWSAEGHAIVASELERTIRDLRW